MMDTKQTVMDIAMNLNRIGNWVADDYHKNKKKINIFIENTDIYVSTVRVVNGKFNNTWVNFLNIYSSMKTEPQNNAENLMTWGNILTHRSKLI